MKTEELIQIINNDFAIQLPLKKSFEELQTALAEYINHLIRTNFEKLIFLLYRIDISEKKLKHFLIDKPNEDIGNIIACLIIERQKQKLTYRNQFKVQNDNFNEEEKW